MGGAVSDTLATHHAVLKLDPVAYAGLAPPDP